MILKFIKLCLVFKKNLTDVFLILQKLRLREMLAVIVVEEN